MVTSFGVLRRISFETGSTSCVRLIRGVNYRILYFFAGKNIVVVSHGLTKEREVPAAEIRRAIERKAKFERDPAAHTYKPGK